MRIKEMLEGKMKRYLVFGFVEIFLIVSGILIALAINRWDIKRSERNDELQIYQALKERIMEDKNVILADVDYNNTYLAQFRFADRIISENDRSLEDTLARIAPNFFKYSDFDNNSFIYQNLVNSGELKILKNSEITSRLQELEEAYIYVNRMENIHWELIIEIVSKDVLNSVNLSTGESTDKEALFDFRFHNRIVLLISIMEEKDGVYQQTLRQIDNLINLIDLEISEK
jgi:hypothetical protein